MIVIDPTAVVDDEPVCEHGTALDVHCCNCHSGFLFDLDACICHLEDAMDTRDGTIYPNLDAALKAGVPEDRLVSGSREALDELRSRIQFHKPGKGPFKPLPVRKAATTAEV